MRILIVGAGALGGLIAARLRAAGSPVWLATRDAGSAAALTASGLRVIGVGGEVAVDPSGVAALDDCRALAPFDLIVLATKARDAIDIAAGLTPLLGPDGTLLPIQNGGVSQMLAERLESGRVLGGVSNLGATMIAPGVYEQRNAGHLLIGEVGGGESKRAARVRDALARGVDTKVTPNLQGAVWSKLLLNCSVTTIGAIAGCTMREYIDAPGGAELFDRAYDEALGVAMADGARLERMVVDPVPPGWCGRRVPGAPHEGWRAGILEAYGGAKPSMLQDLERGRATEIDFINGYVVELGRRLGVPVPANAAIVDTIHAITHGRLSPAPALLARVLRACGQPS